jgi:serine/threonine-protein kinase
MSPESIRAPDRMDGQSDLYALAAVGYYLLTAGHVFEGNSLVEVCGHHLHSTPDPPSMRLGSTVPEDLEGLLLECLEKEPSKRPESAAALREWLRRCVSLGEWDRERARAWWSDHAAELQVRHAAPSAPREGDPSAALPPGSLMSVDVMARGL